MLLQENNKRDINFLEDWPLHYYELPSGIERIKALNEAAVQGICTDLDEYRKIMCEKRFFAKNDKGTTDAFLNAWMMIKASAAAGVSFLQKKRLKLLKAPKVLYGSTKSEDMARALNMQIKMATLALQ